MGGDKIEEKTRGLHVQCLGPVDRFGLNCTQFGLVLDPIWVQLSPNHSAGPRHCTRNDLICFDVSMKVEFEESKTNAGTNPRHDFFQFPFSIFFMSLLGFQIYFSFLSTPF